MAMNTGEKRRGRQAQTALVITFNTTHQAMAMEDCCRREGMSGRLIPLPAELAAGCGLCFKTTQLKKEMWRSFMEREQIKYETMREMQLP